MNIGLIGGGGREHALCQKIYDSEIVQKIICFPGNAGTAKFAKNIYVDILNFKKILNLVKFYKIDLVIVGPEEPLVNGLVDFLKKNNIQVFGPNKYAAKLEGSKAFMKKICDQNNIPTARFKVCSKKKHILDFLSNCNYPVVVKADGLAAGKGVSICNTKKKVLDNSKKIFEGKFKTSKKLILEEFLEGEEASYFIIADKDNFKFFGSAQDHKRVGENDVGPNTGGMGAYSPALVINKIVEKKIINKIIKPTLMALKRKNKPYSGFLYVGLMIKNNEPYLIEYNVRMGDPECQVILPRLKSDLIEIILATVNNKIKNKIIEWKKDKCMTIVLCSKGYPDIYKKNIEIKNLDKLKLSKNDFVFHAGTKFENGKLLSNGGRVINISSTGKRFYTIRKKILNLLKKLNWQPGFFRRDIGWKVIDKNANN